MTMTRPQSILLGAVLAAAATSLTLLGLDRRNAAQASTLRGANAALSQRVQAARDAASTRARHEPAARPDWDNLTAEVRTRRAGQHEEAAARSDPAAAPAYRNAGSATPADCLQTFAWACDRGDAATVTALIRLDPKAREKAQALLTRVPPPEGRAWNSVEELAGVLLAAAHIESPFPPADVLDLATPEPTTADRVTLRLPGSTKDGLVLERTPGGWRYVVLESAVDEYLRHLGQAAAP